MLPVPQLGRAMDCKFPETKLVREQAQRPQSVVANWSAESLSAFVIPQDPCLGGSRQQRNFHKVVSPISRTSSLSCCLFRAQSSLTDQRDIYIGSLRRFLPATAS